MSAVTNEPPLGGFEERLLTQLKPVVAVQHAANPATARAPTRNKHWTRVPRMSLPGAAAVAALVTATLSLLPAATPTLAQAFPILTGPAHTLPARLARTLRTQWHTGNSPHFDLRRAYAFATPAGTGYVIVDRRARWLCILVPAVGSARGAAGGRCERVTLARLGSPVLGLRVGAGRNRHEIVALLPSGARASARTPAGHTRRLVLHGGVLALLSTSPVTVTTTFPGHRRSRITFTA